MPPQLCTSPPVYADPTVDFSGKWKNQRGSTMDIKMAKGGAISGTYTSYVGSNTALKPITGSVVGHARGDQIVFYVDWVPYSMTNWTGQLLTARDGKEILETVWTNTYNIEAAKEPSDGWSATRTGGDSFTR